MKRKLIFFLFLFLGTMPVAFVFSMQEGGWFKKMISDLAVKISNLSNWNAVKEIPKIHIDDARDKIVINVSDIITDAVYRSYPIIKQQVVDWAYQQISDIKEQIKYGLMVGGGIAVTGLTILVIYKIYDKYLRGVLTKNSALDLMVEAILKLINDALTYPTFSTQIHALLKKDQFKIGFDETNEMFFEACNKVIDQITAPDSRNQRNKEQDEQIDKAINKIIVEMVPYISAEEKLRYITKNYINNKNKFGAFAQAVINEIEKDTIALMGTDLSKKFIEDRDGDINANKTILLRKLTIEQRAAYSLYLRLKNKIAVEAFLSPEQRAAKNPWIVQKSIPEPIQEPMETKDMVPIDTPIDDQNASSGVSSLDPVIGVNG